MIGQAVDVGDGKGVDGLGPGQLGDRPFGAANDGAGEMEGGRGLGAARQDETLERREFRVHAVDFGFQAVDLCLDDAKRAFGALCASLILAPMGPAEIGAEVEEVVLDTRKRRVGLARGVEPGEPDDGVGLIHRAQRGDPGIVLGDAGAVAKGGFALVPATGVDLCQAHHRNYLVLEFEHQVGERDQDQCQRLKRDARAHQLVGETRVVIVAPEHGEDAGNQHRQGRQDGEADEIREQGG